MLRTMKRLIPVVVTVLFLAGCASSTPEPTSSPTPKRTESATRTPTPTPTPTDTLGDQYLARVAELGKYVSEDRDTALMLAKKYCTDIDQYYAAKPDDAWVRFIEDTFGRDRAAVEVFCPQYLGALATAEAGFRDGTYAVSSTPARGVIAPGTYRTAGSPKDCYWESVAGDGSTIANDFVSFAPDGITVTVDEGEGFVSQGCGNWLRQ